MSMKIKERLFTCRNKFGHEFSAVHEVAPENARSPLVIICPGYEKTIRDGYAMSVFLLQNGFQTIRFDNTCSLGNSDGDILDFSVVDAMADMEAMLESVERTEELRGLQIGLVAVSLSFLPALRLLTSAECSLDLLVGLVGAVDMQHTLGVVFEEDVVGQYLAGKRQAEPRIAVKYLLNLDNFLKRALEGGFKDLRDTRRDLEKITTPVVNICAGGDDWVKLSDVENVFNETASVGPREVFVVPSSFHHLGSNPQAALRALEQMVASCIKHLKKDETPGRIVVPDLMRFVNLQHKERGIEWGDKKVERAAQGAGS